MLKRALSPWLLNLSLTLQSSDDDSVFGMTFTSRVHVVILMLAANGQSEAWLGDAPKASHQIETL